MTTFFARLGVLLVAPAVFGAIHYAVASRSDGRATHYVPPTTQSAIASPEVAQRVSITLEALRRRLEGEGGVLIDARSPDLYAAGHIPGARNFPTETVEADVMPLVAAVEPDADVFVYCENPSCEDSSRLYDIMTGLLEYRNVRLFPGGYEAWTQAGLPVVKGPPP